MKKVLVAMSHALTEAQIEDLNNNGYEPVVSEQFVELGCNRLDPNLKSTDLWAIAHKLVKEAKENNCQAIAMTGEPGLTFCTWTWAEENGLNILQSTTQRDTVEKVQADGSVIKTQIFRHVQWRYL